MHVCGRWINHQDLMTPREFTSAIVQLETKIRAAAEVGLAAAAELIAEEAKAWIGEEHPNWPPLAERTLEIKTRLGFEVPNPLLRTGTLRDSIHVDVEGLEAEIGTDDPRAPAHELGDNTIPPRPFLTSAVISKGEEAVALIERAIFRVIT